MESLIRDLGSGRPTEMTVRIRPAAPSDRAAIEQLVRDAYGLYTPRIGRAAGPVLADYGALIAAGHVHVLEVSGATLGVLVVVEKDGGMLLDNVAVSPAAQGQGHGRRLIAFAEDLARQAGCRALDLYTNEAMTENLSLYRRLGFVETRRAREAGYSRIYMHKAL